jgi:hypothetical protein
MFIAIKNKNQLTIGSRVKRKDSEEYFEIGEYNEENKAYFLFPEEKIGSFSKLDNIAMGAREETLIADYIIEEIDGGFAREGEGSVKGRY